MQRARRSSSAQIEPVLPGITEQWDGSATVDYWAAYPWTLGSYSYYKPGQYTRFGGAEPELSGACHFAGEHTTQDFQGYLQGAVVERQARRGGGARRALAARRAHG